LALSSGEYQIHSATKKRLAPQKTREESNPTRCHR